MANPPKAKGTAFETAVVRYLIANGVPARRVALTGAKDEGDIHAAGWVLEAKSFADMRAAIRIALKQAPIEAGHAGSDLWAGVVKSPGANVAEAWVVVPLSVFARYIAPELAYDADADTGPIEPFWGAVAPENAPSGDYGPLTDEEAQRLLQ